MPTFPFLRSVLVVTCMGLTTVACTGTSKNGETSSATAVVNEKQQALMTKADVARSLGHDDEAMALYEQAATMSQGAVRAHLELADMYEARGNAAKRGDILEAAYMLNSRNSEVLKEYAQHLLISGENAKAQKIAAAGVAQSPQDVRLLNTLGVALDRAGEHREAQRQYDQAMILAVATLDHASTVNNLALSYIASKDYQKAIALLQEQRESTGGSPALRQLLALAYGANGNRDKAYELSLIDLTMDETTENLRFYRQLREGEVSSAVLFMPAQN